MGAGHEKYYSSLAREDYYVSGGEPLGKWYGRGATSLRLTGNVEKETLSKLFSGFSPDGKALVRNAGSEARRAGFDLTFNAPKSVSVLWSQSSAEVRAVIQRCHERAVLEALCYLEDSALFSRIGAQGQTLTRAGLIAAVFEHGTSRAKDPHLHSHALVLNACVRDNGTTGALEGRRLLHHKMAAGALYRVQLSHELQHELGLRCRQVKSWFEVEGVPEELVEEFSKRRQAIEASLKASGKAGAKASAFAALETRDSKEHVARETLLPEWRKVGEAFGFSPEKLLNRQKAKLSVREETEAIEDAIRSSLKKLTADRNFFGEKELLRKTAETVQTHGVTIKEVRLQVWKFLETSREVVRLSGRTKHEEELFTTKEILALESKLLSLVDKATTQSTHKVKASRVEAAIEKADKALNKKGASLFAEQRDAIKLLSSGDGSIRCLRGVAGTGKTTVLTGVRNAFEGDGYKVVGACVAARAARGLEEGSGISSRSLAKLKVEVEKGKVRFDDRTVLVLDEAGMVSTQDLLWAVEKVSAANGLLLLTGDERQLQAIGLGGGFKEIAKRADTAELKQIVRQKESWARSAVEEFYSGDTAKALSRFASRGLLRLSEDPRQAIDALVEDWARERTPNLSETLIFCGTRAEAALLNRKCQEARREELGTLWVTRGTTQFFQKDRVLFTLNSWFAENGEMGTVSAVNPVTGELTVRLDRGGERVTLASDFDNLSLGYAVTTHKGQGMTVAKAFVLISESMTDREMSNVQVSRAKELTNIYSDKLTAGENADELVRLMNRSRQKELALGRKKERLREE